MSKNKNNIINDPVARELASIKKLIILFLLKAGVKQGEVSKALSVDQSTVSRMFPTREVEIFKWIK